jgi:hypothetical protein
VLAIGVPALLLEDTEAESSRANAGTAGAAPSAHIEALLGYVGILLKEVISVR